jgi:hypothetical protein
MSHDLVLTAALTSFGVNAPFVDTSSTMRLWFCRLFPNSTGGALSSDRLYDFSHKTGVASMLHRPRNKAQQRQMWKNNIQVRKASFRMYLLLSIADFLDQRNKSSYLVTFDAWSWIPTDMAILGSITRTLCSYSESAFVKCCS